MVVSPRSMLRVLACGWVVCQWGCSGGSDGAGASDDGESSQSADSGSSASASGGAGGSAASVSVDDSDESAGGTRPATGGSSPGMDGASGGDDPDVAGAAPTLGGCSMFPDDNPWNADISGYSVHPNSDALIDSIGRDTNLHPDFGTKYMGAPNGIPYVLVDEDQETVSVDFDYADESDPGPYPIPDNPPIEGGPDGDGDRHILMLDTTHCVLYELFNARSDAAGWSAGSGAIFDLASNELRPDRYTSADAAGLPILPGLVRYDEVVERGEIRHALRFTVSSSRRAYISPATHAASSNEDENLPPMGLRVRMKAEFNCSDLSSEVQVICAALKRYGMFVADNGSDWYVSGAPNDGWGDDNLRDLRQLTGDAFEAIDTGPAIEY